MEFYDFGIDFLANSVCMYSTVWTRNGSKIDFQVLVFKGLKHTAAQNRLVMDTVLKLTFVMGDNTDIRRRNRICRYLL